MTDYVKKLTEFSAALSSQVRKAQEGELSGNTPPLKIEHLWLSRRMESLGLQAVALSDGSTAYIKQAIKDGNLVEGDTIQLEDGTTAYIHQVTVQQKEPLPFQDGQAVKLEDSAVEAMQLDDGSTVYIHHPLGWQVGSTILTLQPGSALEELAADDTVDTDTITTLENYAKMTGSDVEVDETMSSTNGLQDIEPIVQVMGSWGSPKGQQTAEKTFRCDYEGCGRLYTTAHHLKVHEWAHTESPAKHTLERNHTSVLKTCFKAFKTSGDLQKHVRTHTDEKLFKCPFEGCGRTFTTSNIRKVHNRTHVP
ncbi:hypothetical protein J4Q44_G00107100 [Coregonus suidteri]|uniref:C2H2-type domain-containing protein n=1 Tax=Coregonus suidteri TaxID=861788 RepID=A0AAN8M020_9TELE